MRPSLIAVLGLITSGCSGGEPEAAVYAHDRCRRVTLTDDATGNAIIGAEDLAFDRSTGELIISAYDRRAAEKAAGKNGPAPMQGGLYAIDPALLLHDESALTLKSIVDPADIEGGLRPHGIDAGGGEVLFINRGYFKEGNKWRRTPSVYRRGADGALEKSETHCAANDVVFAGAGYLVSFDHAACGGFGRLMEDVFAQRKSGVVSQNGEMVVADLSYANGMTLADELLVVAQTRGKSFAMRVGFEPEDTVIAIAKVDGAPDNLTPGEGKKVIVALHPNLLRLAFNRKLGFGRAGSRIDSIDFAGDDAILFNDPRGDLFSAATVAVELEDMLILGSVTGSGLLVCKRSL